MKKTSIYLAIAAGMVITACRGRSETLRRDQQQYQVVQEGQTSGVSSTINAPGEPPPAPLGMTGTNADTTSNFTLPQISSTSPPAPGQPGTLAGTLPVIPPAQATPRPRTTRSSTTVEHTRPAPSETSTTLDSPPPAPSTDTAPPAPTDTQPTTTTT